MSGIFVAQCNCPRDYANLASRLCAQVSSGSESLRRYAVDDRTLLGVSTHDHLKQGEMPVYDPDAGVWVLLEGTLYRTGVEHAHHQLGGTECSSVARLFAALYRSGKLASALPGLNGAFFVVLWDPRERTLIACNDRFGLYPNYWSYNGERFCLAGRVLCSVVAGVVPGEWNPTGVAQLLTTGDISGEDTAIAGVKSRYSPVIGATILRRILRASLLPRLQSNWETHSSSRSEGKAPTLDASASP
jgi:asparagine synthetase B (glutamine-hydrolysing)